MKKFGTNLLIFIILVAALDILCGGLARYMMSHAKGGSTQNNYFIANKMENDVLIMGSSRASHHYIPSVIENLTSFSCYNCGEEGNGSILAYARFKMATDRYKPKVVIYEITPEYDYFVDEDNSKYFRYLKPYYFNRNVKYLFKKFSDKMEVLKLNSKLYQHNSLFLTMLIDNIIFRDNHNGYSPLNGMLKQKKDLKRKTRNIDMKKAQLIESIISECKTKGINLFLVISPRFISVNDDEYYTYAYSLAKANETIIFDFRKVKGISDNPVFFNDLLHLNDKGANYYTQHYICNMLNNGVNIIKGSTK